MKDDLKREIKGKVDNLKGRVKEAIGALSGNKSKKLAGWPSGPRARPRRKSPRSSERSASPATKKPTTSDGRPASVG